MAGPTEVDWERLDKHKFFVYGSGIFTGLTAALFPLSVIKTRMMALEGAPRGLSGAVATAQSVVRHDGVRGLYKGFGTVLCGLIPARMLYLGVLEASKSGVLAALQRYPQLGVSDTAAAGVASFVAGGTASLAGQLVVVPIDVISQRLMLIGGGPADGGAAAPSAGAGAGSSAGGTGGATRVPRVTGLHLAREIVRQEGVRGMYRGLGASIATFVPSSAIWWASYGAYQTALWHQVDRLTGREARDGSAPDGTGPTPAARREREIVAVQVAAGLLTGCTSAVLTNPLDLIKTRLQTRRAEDRGPRPTWLGVARQLAREEGPRGFLRGVAPRMVSASIWGTAMVSTYEFLKRMCVLPPGEAGATSFEGEQTLGRAADGAALVRAVPGQSSAATAS